MPVAAHAEPFALAGGRTGVLLLHGFTGSPVSMRPWAEALAGAGYSIRVPRLPGHGTSWQALNTTGWQDWYAEAAHGLTKLADACDAVFVAGLSMGGCLALRLAEQRPDAVDGLLLVNPVVASRDRRLLALPLLKRLRGSIDAIGNDIRKTGVEEYSYDRTPLRALDSMRAMWRTTRADLPRVQAPLLLFRSATDHVVDDLSAQVIMQRVGSSDRTERVLHDSYHVAVLDHDAPRIFSESVEFIAAHDAAQPATAESPHAV